MTMIASAGLARAQDAARPFYQGKVIQVLSPYDGGNIENTPSLISAA
jgi:hypothetical protein